MAYLEHIGKPHVGATPHSGRYKWGSGEDPYQRYKDFNDLTVKLANKGMSEKDIANDFGFSSVTELRDYKSIASTRQRSMAISRVTAYRDRGWSIEAISEKTGIPQNTVRDYLKPEADRKAQKFEATVDTLRKQADNKKYLDVSHGTEEAMGVPTLTKQRAIRALKTEGYETFPIKVESVGTNERTTTLVLVPPGTTFKDVYSNRFAIEPFSGSVDSNKSNLDGWVKPLAVDPKRVSVRYKEDGGATEDGVMYLRPGVKDLSMGGSLYSQVRIQVGDSHYLKGVAMYKDDLPEGTDILFNSPKSRSVGKLATMKPLKKVVDENGKEVPDPDNPFGSTIRKQIKEVVNGKSKAVSAVNIVNEEETWDSWSKNLSPQFLAKQSLPLAKAQLDLTRSNKKAELDEIMSITNPTVKKQMLLKYADDADASAVHLKAAALPRQKTHVILPITSLKDNEIYAPNFENGERVVLIRYPHAGTFEIPELKVNNKNEAGIKMIGQAKAAVGINHKVAEKLSGADFDGDTVVVIPNNSGRIKSTKSLKGLADFDAKERYGPPANMDADKPPYRLMKKTEIQAEMGKVSNLITDMSIGGANENEMARAARHSMVVIDAHKHKLDYKRSEVDNDIPDLKRKYQDKGNGKYGGASTLLSRSKGDAVIEDRRLRRASEGGPIDRKTGEIAYVPTGKKKKKKLPDGTWVESDSPLQTRISKMEATKDAHTLSSGTPIEKLYGDHANSMKTLGNKARLEYLKTGKQVRKPEMAVKYKEEVESLEAKLRKARANAPKERQAQRIANTIVKEKKDANPLMDKDEEKKVKGQALEIARERTGAKKDRIVPTEREWEAIQAGAVSENRLTQILANGDRDAITKLATPKASTTLSPARQALIRSMSASGYNQAEIAKRLGISASTVNNYL